MAQLLSNFGADLTGLRQGASCAAREKTPFFLQPIRVCRHALVALSMGPSSSGRPGRGARNPSPQRGPVRSCCPAMRPIRQHGEDEVAVLEAENASVLPSNSLAISPGAKAHDNLEPKA